MVVWSAEATVTVEVSSAPPNASPVWVDFTDRVRTIERGQPIDVGRGRQNVLSQMEPSRMSIVFENSDSALTSGYTGSPYYPWWKEHRRIRVRETLGSRTFDLYNGFIEVPEVREVLEGVDNLVTVTAVDRLARLSQGRPLLSVLGEYILANANSSLKAYYPMGDEQAPFRDESGNNRAPIVPYFGGNVFTAPGNTSVNPASSTPVTGDDLPTVVYETPHGLNVGVEMSSQYWSARADFAEGAIPITSGQVCTAVIWVKPDLAAWGDEKCPLNIVTWEDGTVTGSAIQIFHNDSAAELIPTPWIGSAIEGNLSGFTLGGQVDDGCWTPLAVRFGYDASEIELWYRSSQTSDTLTVTPTTTRSIATIYCPDFRWAGSIAHLQIYIGAESDYTHDDFLAQVEVGWTGHNYQRTGERIAMVAAYANVPHGDLELDAGQRFMQKARLAGRTAGEVMQECAETERGRLFCAGDGRIVFQDALRTYNV